MSLVKPLADASERAASVDQRDFGFREGWLRELERAQADLLGHASSPGERTSPQADAPRRQDASDPPAVNATSGTSPVPAPPIIVLPVARGPSVAVVPNDPAVARREPAASTIAKAFESSNTQEPSAPAPASSLERGAGEVPPGALPLAAASPSSRANVPTPSVLPSQLQSANPSPEASSPAVATATFASDSRSAPVSPSASATPSIDEMPPDVTPRGAGEAVAMQSLATQVAKPVGSATSSAIQSPVLTNESTARMAASITTTIAPSTGSGVETRATRTQEKPRSASASTEPERADPPPRRRVHVHANGSEASVWVRDTDLDPVQSQGLLGRVAIQLALAGRKLRSFAVNGRVIFGPSRAASGDSAEAPNNPIQQAKR